MNGQTDNKIEDTAADNSGNKTYQTSETISETEDENGLSQEHTAASIDGEMKTVEDISKRKKKNRWGFLLTVVLFACVVYALWTISNTMGEGNSATFIDLLKVVDWKYIIIALAVMFFMMLCDVLKYGILTRSYDCKLSFGKQCKLALVGKYYCAITPTSTGGQPMQIYYLHTEGVSGAKSSSVALMNYTVQMFSAAIVAAIVMLSCMGFLSVIDNVAIQRTLTISGWIGFGINACAPVFITIIIFKPNFLKWLVNLGLVLLHKMHILKKLDERREKIYKGIDEFAVCSQFVMTHPWKFIQLILLGCVEPLCVCVFPYLVLLAFCGDSVTNSPQLLFTVAALATYSTYAVVYIPTPGNSGAYETMFMLAFASISGDIMFWVAIVSRFFNYYVYIVFGLGMNAVEFVSKLIKKRKKHREAQNES